MSKFAVAKQSGALTRLEVALASAVLRLRESSKTALQHAREVGDLLLQAKDLVPHGEWAGWVDRFGISTRSAQAYMRISEAWARLKYAVTADLTLNGALRLLAKPRRKIESNEPVPEPETSEAHASASAPAPARAKVVESPAAKAAPVRAADAEPGSDEDVIPPLQEAVRSAIARLVAATGKWQAAFHEAWSAVAGIPEYGPLFVKQLGAPIAKSGWDQQSRNVADPKVQTRLVVVEELAHRISRLMPDHRCEGCGGNGCGKCRGLGFVIRGDAGQEARPHVR